MKKTRVLVVDDDVDARELLSLVLSQAGFQVDDAPDGFAALAKVSHVRPDAVLTDLRMPGMDGIDLAQRIRRVHGDVPIIIATGLETWDLCTSAEAYGAVTCLIKPLDFDDLVWTIEMAIACRQGAAQAGRAAI